MVGKLFIGVLPHLSSLFGLLSKKKRENEKLEEEVIIIINSFKNLVLSKEFMDAVKKQVFPYTPIKNIYENWPLIVEALDRRCILDKDFVCYSLATILVENSKFTSIKEVPSKWSTKNKQKPYDFSNYLNKGGNKTLSDCEKYRGSGYLQLTLKNNFIDMDKKLKLDGGLVEQGWKAAIVPQIAAAIFAQYMFDREDKARAAFIKKDYATLRKLVNGPAMLHLDKFTKAYQKVEKILEDLI